MIKIHPAIYREKSPISHAYEFLKKSSECSFNERFIWFSGRGKDDFLQHEITVTLYSKVCLIFDIYFHLSTLLMTTHFFIKNYSTTSYRICI